MWTRRMTVLLLSAVLFAFLATGCGSKQNAEPAPHPVDADTIERQPTDASDSSPARGDIADDVGTATVYETSSDAVEPGESVQDRPGTDTAPRKKELEISSNDETPDEQPAVPATLEEEKQPVSRSNLQQLMGIALTHTREQVIGKYGTPVETFAMENGADPLTVYRYSGFQVGFNRDGRIEFVDVHSPEADPGLNGVRLGTTVDDTIKVLGQPDIQTDYVLNYVSETAILKMDIDPNTKQISSIKLFAP